MTDKAHILIVEDEDDIVALLRFNLENAGYTVSAIQNGVAALDTTLNENPNLVLLDLMLPGSDGITIAKTLKKHPKTQQIPIIMITAKTDEADIVAGLESGADDYITKPFSLPVVLARVKAVLRRKSREDGHETESLTIGNMEINKQKMSLKVLGEDVALKSSEFKCLYHLAKAAGWVFTRNQLIDAIKGEEAIISDRNIDVMMVSLRKKLGPTADYIETVRGIGYRFKETIDA